MNVKDKTSSYTLHGAGGTKEKKRTTNQTLRTISTFTKTQFFSPKWRKESEIGNRAIPVSTTLIFSLTKAFRLYFTNNYIIPTNAYISVQQIYSLDPIFDIDFRITAVGSLDHCSACIRAAICRSPEQQWFSWQVDANRGPLVTNRQLLLAIIAYKK